MHTSGRKDHERADDPSEDMYDSTPHTAFYNWIYPHVLSEHPEIGGELMNYDAFTDIAFGSEKSINCQTEICAFYVAFRKEAAREHFCKQGSFLDILYGVKR